MNTKEFWDVMKKHQVTFWSGVPCSWLGGLIDYAISDEEITYTPAPREDIAVGLASSCYFSGGLGGILIQNSGLGNILGPLTSFNLLYKIPIFIVMSLRDDAPEHLIMGKTTVDILRVLSIPCSPLSSFSIETLVEEAIRDRTPMVGLVMHGSD